MRPSASLCQSSRYRLLTVTQLFVLLLGVFCVQTVGGSRSASANLGLPELLNSESQLVGGTPLARDYHLLSQCKGYVQVTPASGRFAVNARGSASSDFARLTLESHSPTELKILGVKTQKYICFSRRGRLIARYNGRSKRCMFHAVDKGGYVMLRSVAQPSWYVGFKKNGLSKKGYSMSLNKAAQGGASVSGRPHPRPRGRKSQRQNHKRRDKRRRGRHGLSRANREKRRRGGRQGRDRTMCFQFILRRTERDLSDPRVQNSMVKKIHDPWKDSDVSKFISTPNPR